MCSGTARLLVLVALAGCASAPVVTATREASTGLAPGEAVAVRLISRTSAGDKQWQVAGERGGGAIARTWKETAELRAEVIDVRHQRVALRAEASASGEEGRGVMPIVYWSSAERKACEALGSRLAVLLAAH